MNLNPDSSAPTPVPGVPPAPAPQPPLVQPPAATPSAPVLTPPAAARPLTPPPTAPAAPVLTPPPAKPPVKLAPPAPVGLRPPGSPAPVASGVPAVNKLPDAPKFVSPMPSIEEADDSIPVFLPIVAGFAAAASVAFAVLLFLKQ